ncbi:MAG: hydrolase [Rickettsiales bacterium]|nr:MAG: hydrolase [Rickettsiales bacterium]
MTTDIKKPCECPEIAALSGKAKKLMVMLHGVGSDGNDLISLVPFLQDHLPDYHFIAPDGIEAYDMAPFGRQWFSLQDRDPQVIGGLVSENAPKAYQIIAKKQQELGLSNADTTLFGFSQGTMLGVYMTLMQEAPFAAMLAFSGRLITPMLLQNTQTPICIVHGEQDDVVPAQESDNMAKYCSENNIEHRQIMVPNLGHSIDASGIEFALNFLKGE